MPPIPKTAPTVIPLPAKFTGTQMKVLRELANTKGLLSRQVLLSNLGYAHGSGLADVLGRNDASKRSERDKKVPSLISLGLIELLTLDVEGVTENVYRITERGRTVYAEHSPKYNLEPSK